MPASGFWIPASKFRILHFSLSLFAKLGLARVMNLEEDIEVVCPYCGARFTTCADTSVGNYSTIEDCEICCRPIELTVACHIGGVEAVEATRA